MCVEKIGKGLKIFSFNFSTGGGGRIVEKSVENVDKLCGVLNRRSAFLKLRFMLCGAFQSNC